MYNQKSEMLIYDFVYFLNSKQRRWKSNEYRKLHIDTTGQVLYYILTQKSSDYTNWVSAESTYGENSMDNGWKEIKKSFDGANKLREKADMLAAQAKTEEQISVQLLHGYAEVRNYFDDEEKIVEKNQPFIGQAIGESLLSNFKEIKASLKQGDEIEHQNYDLIIQAIERIRDYDEKKTKKHRWVERFFLGVDDEN